MVRRRTPPATIPATAMSAMLTVILAVVPVEAKKCFSSDVLPAGANFSSPALVVDFAGCAGSLNLQNNAIGDSGAAAIAEALKTNTAVRILRLQNNNIGDSGAAAIAEALKTNTALRVLRLQNNKIGDSGAATLAHALESNTAVTELHLYNNNIGDRGAAAIAEALKSNTALCNTLAELHNSNIGDSGAAAIAEALKTNTAVRVLHLHNNNIGDSGAAALAQVLESNTAVTELHLYNNNIGDRGAAAIAEALKSNTSLTRLSLQNNNIGDSGAAAISEALKSNTALTRLWLQNNTIGDSGAVAISEALKSNTALTMLWLQNNTIGDSGAVAISEALNSHTALTGLSLDNNPGISNAAQQLITGCLAKNAVAKAILGGTTTSVTKINAYINDIGAAAIAEALKNNTVLTFLNLDTNNIEDSGAAAISEALKANTALTWLYLRNNMIGDSGAAAIAEALKTNTALTRLWLQNSTIGDSGAAAIAEALKNNTALTMLHLGSNNIGNSGATAIAEALKSNTALAKLDLDNNPGISDATQQLITGYLAKNEVNQWPTVTHFNALSSPLSQLKHGKDRCPCMRMRASGMGSNLHTFGQALWNMHQANHSCFAVEKRWSWDPDSTVFNFSRVDHCDKPFDGKRHEFTSTAPKKTVRAAALSFVLSNYLASYVYDLAQHAARLLGGATPTNLVTVHVRWGDKHLEAPQTAISRYIDAVHAFNLTQPVVYITTEDLGALRAFTKRAPPEWSVKHYTAATSKYATGAQNSPKNFAARNPQAGLHSMIAFILGMQSKYFVLTSTSNWSRMFIEMCVVRQSNACVITDLSNKPYDSNW